MADLPGQPAFESDRRAGAEQDQGWGSPVPAEYGSLRAVSSRRDADGRFPPPDEPAPSPPERSVVASLLRRIQGEPNPARSTSGAARASANDQPAPGWGPVAAPGEPVQGLPPTAAVPLEAPGGEHTGVPPEAGAGGAGTLGESAPPWSPADGASAESAVPGSDEAGSAPTVSQPRLPAEAGPGPTLSQPRLPAEAGPGPTLSQPRLPAEAGPGPTVSQPRLPAEAGLGASIGGPVQPPGIDPTALGDGLGLAGLYGRGRARRRMGPGRARSRATIRHIDLFTVIRVSVLFWLVILVSVVLASVLLWVFADAFGSLPSIEKSIRTLFSLKSFKLHPGQVAFYTALGGFVISVIGIIANVLFALIYNLIADIVGGVRVEQESFTPE